MNYEKPSEKDFTVYTKKGCPYCIKVKDLLENEKVKFVECDPYISKNKENFLDFIESQAGGVYRTFPMVFFDGKFIGGYNETKTNYDKFLAFKEMDEEDTPKEPTLPENITIDRFVDKTTPQILSEDESKRIEYIDEGDEVEYDEGECEGETYEGETDNGKRISYNF